MIKINKKFIVFTFIAFVFAFILGGNLPYAIFYTFMVALIVETIYIWRISKKLYLNVDILRKFYTVGEKESVNILVKNYSVPYVYIRNKTFKLFNNKYNGHCVFVDSSGSEIINVPLDFQFKGMYDLGNFDVEIYDLFNIFSLRKNKYVKNKYVKIYPKIHPIRGQWILGDGNSETKSELKSFIDDNSAVKDVRKYVNGDSLKKVHWKLSAKHGELYVKNFENVYGKTCNILLNMCKDDFVEENRSVVEEEVIEACASLVNFMNNNKIKAKLFINDKKGSKIEIYNKVSFNEFMEDMVNEHSDGEVCFEKFLNMNLKYLENHGVIYLITSRIDKDLLGVLFKLVEKRYKVILIYNVEYLNELSEIETINKMGVNAINIKSILNNEM